MPDKTNTLFFLAVMKNLKNNKPFSLDVCDFVLDIVYVIKISYIGLNMN